MSEPMTVESHATYVREIFGALFDWERISGLATDLMGSIDFAVAIGLDQLGHFGPQGVRLVAQRLVDAADGPLTRIVELGSGFAGATRHMFRELNTKDVHGLLVGVDIVHAHSAHGGHIGRSIEETDPRLVTAGCREPAVSPVRGASTYFMRCRRRVALRVDGTRARGVFACIASRRRRGDGGRSRACIRRTVLSQASSSSSIIRSCASRLSTSGGADFERAGLEIDAFESRVRGVGRAAAQTAHPGHAHAEPLRSEM